MEKIPTVKADKGKSAVLLQERWYDMTPYNFFLTNEGGGWFIFAKSREKKFSIQGAAVLSGFAAMEGGYGRGNGGESYHNPFSIMGGAKGNIGTSHGRLQKYASWEKGLEAFFDHANKLWTDLLITLSENEEITEEDLNRSLNTFDYFKYPAYNGDKNVNQGKLILNTSKIAIDFIVGFLERDIENLSSENRVLIAQRIEAIKNKDYSNAAILNKQIKQNSPKQANYVVMRDKLKETKKNIK